MTSREKRFEKIILAQETDYPYDWIENFLEYHGYCGSQMASSHVIFRKEGSEPVVIVVHHNSINHYYVRRMIKILKRQRIL